MRSVCQLQILRKLPRSILLNHAARMLSQTARMQLRSDQVLTESLKTTIKPFNCIPEIV